MNLGCHGSCENASCVKFIRIEIRFGIWWGLDFTRNASKPYVHGGSQN